VVGRIPSVLTLDALETIDMGDLLYHPIRRALLARIADDIEAADAVR
jgi:hypothetical protein